VIIWLLAIASHAEPGTDQANARLDAVRTGLAAGAGAAAAVGLGLAFRRQHHQEIATVLTDLDATERRITELYTKAVEQLGNDRAPVRLGGLYALERLAQDNQAHRQTTVDVICAYLRMPFSSTAPTSKPEPEAAEDLVQPANETETRTIGDTWSQERDTWQQERQVRLTAQRILAEHLRDDRTADERSTEPPSPRFWPDTRLDLAGATLIDLDLRRGVMAAVDFSGATFSGLTTFDGATFDDIAAFGRATFNDVGFIGATFGSDAVFAMSTFNNAAVFGGANFQGGEGSLSFERSRVLSSHAGHAWPTGWHLGPNGSGGYTVVSANDDASRPIHVDGSDGSQS
jgi:Pentapeptide repeats (9 copies)